MGAFCLFFVLTRSCWPDGNVNVARPFVSVILLPASSYFNSVVGWVGWDDRILEIPFFSPPQEMASGISGAVLKNFLRGIVGFANGFRRCSSMLFWISEEAMKPETCGGEDCGFACSEDVVDANTKIDACFSCRHH